MSAGGWDHEGGELTCLGLLGGPFLWLFCLIYSLLAMPSFLPTLGLVTVGVIVISLLVAERLSQDWHEGCIAW